MKTVKVLMMMLVVLCLPALAAAEQPDPNFGVKLELSHYSNGNDQQDILISNYASGDLVFEGVESQSCVSITPWGTDGFPEDGIKDNIGPYDEYQASLSTLLWDHTKEDDPYLALNYTLDGHPLTLMLFPQHQHSGFFTDLMFAWHIIKACAAVVEIAVGDEFAMEQLAWNIERAVHEGNKMGSEPNFSWAGVSRDSSQDMWSNPDNLTYSILYQHMGGEYVFGKSASDHIAFDIEGEYVVQLACVNTTYDDYTNNTQLSVNIYDRDDWDTAMYPYGHVQWWNTPTGSGGGYYPRCAASDGSDYTYLAQVYVHSDSMYLDLGWINRYDNSYEFPSWNSEIVGGHYPSVDLCGDKIVTVHQGTGHDDNHVYFRLGTIQDEASGVDWTYAGGSFYDHANLPDVAFNGDGIVFAVFEDTNDSFTADLSYAVGLANSGSTDMDITVTTGYDKGYYPSVSVAGDHFLEVHKSQSDNTLWYNSGRLDAGYLVSFMYNGALPDECEGTTPSVGMNENGVVVVAYENSDGDMAYVVGQFDWDDGTVDWEEPISEMSAGYYWPSIDISKGDSYVISTAQDTDGDYCYFKLGWLIDE